MATNHKSSQPDKIESGRLDLNNNSVSGSNGVNNTAGSAMNHLANQTNLINSLSNNQAGERNGRNESPAAFGNQPAFTNGPMTTRSSEPNSISNSRNSYPDETNSFSNSVTPDQSNVRADRLAKERTATPITSPVANRADQLHKARSSNESIQQGKLHQQISQNGLSSSANKVLADKKFKHYESQLINGIKVPQKRLRLKKIFGYNGNVGNNLQMLATEEIAYFVGVFVVLWDPVLNVQRHYAEHTEDIVW